MKLLLTATSLLLSMCVHAQIGNVLKQGGKLLDKSPTKLLEKYFNNAPVTTSFDDARTEVMLLGHFDPPDVEFQPFDVLDQNDNGDYIITEGLYTQMNKSFCLKAGTYGPSQGDGHLLAPLAGPKAYLIQNLLVNWLAKAPDIPQTDVQCLIWAIIARTDVDKMQPKYKLTLARLLDKDDMAKLAANSLKDKALEAGLDKLQNEIPSEVYQVLQAERKLRSTYSRADATYNDFEQMAILAGMAPAAHMIRPVSKARWSYHPNGYFIRMTPHGYQSTKVDVYVPHAVIAKTDPSGRILSLSYKDDKIVDFFYTTAASNSTLTGIKFYEEFKSEVKLNANVMFVSDFNISNTDRSASFAKKINSEHSILRFAFDQQVKTRLFNLYNAIETFSSLSPQAMNPSMAEFTLRLLNEAYNYEVYKHITLTGNASVMDDNAEFFVVNSPAKFGPLITLPNIPVMNDHFLWYKQDKGTLDLSDNVATPANRSAQRIGQSKPPKKKKWYETLPDCPCTYAEAQKLAKQSGSGWSDCGGANQDFHYGAASEVRWIPPKAGQPGQQCTYDQNGNLITSGIGAGTPDKVSPQGCEWYSINPKSVQSFYGHKTKDMDPWWELSCEEYLKKWPPNNGNNCADNGAADFSHMKDIVKDLNCDEITKMFKSANDPNDKRFTPRVKDFINGKIKSKQDMKKDVDAIDTKGMSDAEKSLIQKLRKAME